MSDEYRLKNTKRYCRDCNMFYENRNQTHEALHRLRAKINGEDEQDDSMKVEQTKRSSGPPSPLTIERIMELKEHELFSDEDRQWLHESIFTRKMLDTQGQAGILVSLMKKKINAKGGKV
jgi:hypothetical protein